VNWRLQITADGKTDEPVVFSNDSAYDDAVVFIGVAMIVAADRCRKFSVEIEPVGSVTKQEPQEPR
jgi:hypothetical protein